MQPTRLTVEGALREPELEEGETNVVVDDVEQVTLSIAGDPAAVSQGWGGEPYQCAYDGTGMPVGSDPCPECGRNNVVPTPLGWVSSAAIVVDPDADMVLLRLNLLSGGVLQLEVSRKTDGSLIIHTPREGTIPLGDMVVKKISDGAYQIKE